MLARLAALMSGTALVAAACCVLPMVLVLLGVGGAWGAIVARAAVPAPWLVAVSVVLVVAAWLAALRTRPPRGGRATLALATVAAAAAWTVWAHEATLNDWLITLM
jgi:hypothetical protein